MAPQDSLPTRRSDSIAFRLPWAHGHQRKAIGDFVAAILAQHTACQAQLARSLGQQAAAVKRVARLRHPARRAPRLLADAVLLQALPQCPQHGTVRLAMAWTLEADQHGLVVSLVVGRHAVPVAWRAYEAAGFKGRMQRYARAGSRRAVGRVAQAVGKRRVIVTADRGFGCRGPGDLPQPVGRDVHPPRASWHPRRGPGPGEPMGARAVAGPCASPPLWGLALR